MNMDKVMKKYRIYLVIDGMLYWGGSYTRKGDALRYLKETGSHGLRAMLTEGEPEQWLIMVDGVVTEPDAFTSLLLGDLPRVYQKVR